MNGLDHVLEIIAGIAYAILLAALVAGALGVALHILAYIESRSGGRR